MGLPEVQGHPLRNSNLPELHGTLAYAVRVIPQGHSKIVILITRVGDIAHGA